jgi:hypothetical protein
MSPAELFDKALYEAQAGNLEAAKTFAQVGLLGYLLSREQAGFPALPLSDMGDAHRPVAEWAGLRPGEQDPRD